MKILDANMILRFLIQDDESAADIVEKLIENEEVLVLPEVIAEVIYVMTKVYHIDRSTTVDIVSSFLDDPHVKSEKTDVLIKGICRLPFVCILYCIRL